ncbi:hypothetical protein [Acinetobacter baumannii]|uniref:hypothetical protein n=1 Tax=Acinetobacter baumannii TaxID=470 RepID=UPI0018870211|nr:hypothetical protein [Acinetobacter baumannii]MBF1880822.1 hypothetical protein [Acinetobacter baumannii]HEM7081246.1 hypothetical protein [Acinetobacter baumannii]
MNIYMTEEDVLSAIAGGDVDANDLLNEANPNFEKRFKRLNTALAKLLDEVREYFPDANYYSPNDGMVLLLGSSHADKDGQPPQQELVAANSDALSGRISGGDW